MGEQDEQTAGVRDPGDPRRPGARADHRCRGHADLLSTTFAQDGVGGHKGFEYSRSATRPARRSKPWSPRWRAPPTASRSPAVSLRRTTSCACCARASAILLGNDAYGGTFRLISKVWGPLGIPWTAVDLTDLDGLRDWPDDVGMVWLETPTNPLLTCVDIEASPRSPTPGRLVVVDNTFATPYLQQPLTLGADVVVHSATKYLGGHSDVVGGFVAVDDDELAERMRFTQNAAGAVPAPFDCYLVLRGVKTLGVRMERHCENARAVVDLLVGHPAVERVLYPQLPDHPGHAAAARQMRDFGGMVSFTLRGGMTAAMNVAASTDVFTLAESLGAVESLIEHPAAMTHASAAGSPLEVPDNARAAQRRHRGRRRPRRRPRTGARPRPMKPPTDRPIVIAANRLPVMRTDDGWTASPGGLVRALLPMLRDTGGTWVGWTGNSDDHTDAFEVEGVDLQPVPISAEEIELYYEGFSNDALWPLYHDALRESTYSSEQWDAYVAVNERFAVTIANIAPPDSIVWIHDYQLQLVPERLRQQRSDITIGFFLHIPFPPYELFSRLPWRSDIVDGLLGCDLIGFQRPKDAANFVAAAHELADVGGDEAVIRHGGRHTSVGAFPISIDVGEVEEVAAGRATRQRMSQIRARLGDPEVILLGVDRLDYTKGIGLRLKAFAALLESGELDPERHVMVQVATPTREAVEHYQDERHEVERLVGEINGRYSRIGLPVVHYLYQTLPFDELIALYRAGDVMLVTPFRDGMNLVAKEYAASHIDGDGVLVLSEFAGAADELTDAVLVNPHDDHALQQAIITAVEMHRHDRRGRMAGLRDQIRKSDVQGWADRFRSQLAAASAPPADSDRSG
jgi:trehalose 6-phosphate synthase